MNSKTEPFIEPFNPSDALNTLTALGTVSLMCIFSGLILNGEAKNLAHNSSFINLWDRATKTQNSASFKIDNVTFNAGRASNDYSFELGGTLPPGKDFHVENVRAFSPHDGSVTLVLRAPKIPGNEKVLPVKARLDFHGQEGLLTKDKQLTAKGMASIEAFARQWQAACNHAQAPAKNDESWQNRASAGGGKTIAVQKGQRIIVNSAPIQPGR